MAIPVSLDYKKVTLGEKDLLRSVVQNVRTILRTPKYTVPLDREFGMNTSFVDSPITVVPPLLIAEIREAIEEYEPRCSVTNIAFGIDKAAPGKLIPTVEVEIHG